MNPSLILASGSRFKRAELARLGIPFESIDADIDESSLDQELPDALARRLARDKALAVHASHPDAFVIGGDQVVSFQGEQLHKPHTNARAITQLERLQGHIHDIFCSVALVTPTGEVYDEVVHVAMHMRSLTRAQIQAYVLDDDVVDSAGSYTIEAGGIRLFSAMKGDDYTAIIGLPLTRVLDMLIKANYPLPHTS